MNRRWVLIFCLTAIIAVVSSGCDGNDPAFETELSPVHTELNYIKDSNGRYLHFRGTNVGGSSKVPVFEPMLDVPIGSERGFSYVGRPFAPGEEDKWFGQLRDLGFNSIRLLFIWEAVFPDEKGKPDEEFLAYFRNIVAKANEYGIYVLFNMHENMWSRHLYAKYNEDVPATCDSDDGLCIDNLIMPLFGPYTDKVAGDGAPLWATKLCLPDKNFDSEFWGMHHIVGRINDPFANYGIGELAKTLKESFGMDADHIIDFVNERAPEDTFAVTDTCDMLPWTFWGTNNALSLDVERCYASLFAGSIVYPEHTVVQTKDGKLYIRRLAEGDDPEAVEYVMNGQKHDIAEDNIENTWPIEDYLQESFAEAWVEIAKIGKDYPNVIGYDMMNEPVSLFILMTAASAYFDLGLDSAIGDLLHSLFVDKEDPDASNTGDDLWLLIRLLELLPPNTDPETKEAWGFKGADLFSIVGLNTAFAKNHLQPLYEKVGKGILEVYHQEFGTDYQEHAPILYLEPGIGIDSLLGGGEGGGMGGQWQQYMTLPRFEEKYQPVQMVYTPHWYPDIYPNLGFNKKPRMFTDYEYIHRDYTADLEGKIGYAEFALNNIPVVFGEFGTYWNYRYASCDPPDEANSYNPAFAGVCEYYEDGQRPENEVLDYSDTKARPGYEQSRYHDYKISATILDNYYESFEKLFLDNIQWCYTSDNDPVYGDLWNHEDFSLIDEQGQPRGWQAWVRPYPRAMSGKPVHMHFNSPLHYYDPDKGKVDPYLEFELIFESKETDAPTIIYVPTMQYIEGFYVWLSDGWAAWDTERQQLYYHPEEDAPDWQHRILIRPPQEGQTTEGYDYFIGPDGRVISAR